MPSAGFYRTKARGYLRQAGVCGDEILAQELRNLARSYAAEADRLDRERPTQAASDPEIHYHSLR